MITTTTLTPLEARAERIAAQFRRAGHKVKVEVEDHGYRLSATVQFERDLGSLNYCIGHVILSQKPGSRTRFDSILVLGLSCHKATRSMRRAEIIADVYAGLYKGRSGHLQVDFQ